MNLHDEIAKVAYELYEKSGRIEGRDLDNWLEAERIVMERYKVKGKKASAKKSGAKKTAGRAKKAK